MKILSVTGILAVTVALGAGTMLPAQDTKEAQLRINLSSAQAMLAERMTQSVCMLQVDLQPDVYSEKLGQARQTFESNLRVLTTDGSKIGLVNEASAEILRDHDEVNQEWQSYEVVLQGLIESGEFSLSDLDASGLAMLEQTLDAAARTSRVHAEAAADLTSAEALALNIAGRQRMFSQTMLKEMCLLASGTEPSENRARYNETVRLFTASLNGLRKGQPDVGLIPPPNPEIEAKLAEIDEMWQPMRSFMEDFSQEEEPDLIYLEIIADHMNALEKALDDVFVSYEIAVSG